MWKSQLIRGALLANVFYWPCSVGAAPKSAPAKTIKQANKARIAELVQGAFGAIWMDSDMDDADVAKQVAAALDAGASPDSKDEYGDTFLLQAITNNRPQTVSFLLRSGASANLPALGLDGGETPLIRAVTSRDVWANEKKPLTTLVVMLLKHGADPNHYDKEGQTALVLAAADGQVEIVTALLKAGANVQLPTKAGITPLAVVSKPLPSGAANYAQGRIVRPYDSAQTKQQIARQQKVLEQRQRAEKQRLVQGRAEVRRLLLKAGARK